LATALILLGLCAPVGVAAEPAATTSSFDVETLAAGIWFFRPSGDRRDLANALVVERGDGLLVVDSQPTPGAAREFLADLKKVSDRAVRYLVLSHPHAESAGGASAFPESTLLIGTKRCHDTLEDPDFDFGAEARLRAASPREWTDPPRVPPTLILHARARLEDSRHPVELLPTSHAHSAGDMLVQLPEANIIYAGAILPAERNPYAEDARVGNWLNTLNSLAEYRPSTILPLHGPALDLRNLRVIRDSFAWTRGQVEMGFVEGYPPQRIPEWIMESDEVAERFNMEAKPNFVRGFVEQVVAEAVEQRRKRGYE
jgi:glyoxylase-like metal-dependent hydrolase (beta-lactamase superfamily II)